jgi:hypothetical protein
MATAGHIEVLLDALELKARQDSDLGFHSNFDIKKFMRSRAPGLMPEIFEGVGGWRKENEHNPELTAQQARLKARYDIELAAFSHDMTPLQRFRIGPQNRRVEHLALTSPDAPIRDALALVFGRGKKQGGKVAQY